MPPSSLNKGEKFLLFVQITTVQNNKFEISILADFKYVFRNTCEPFGKVKQRIMYFAKPYKSYWTLEKHDISPAKQYFWTSVLVWRFWITTIYYSKV